MVIQVANSTKHYTMSYFFQKCKKIKFTTLKTLVCTSGRYRDILNHVKYLRMEKIGSNIELKTSPMRSRTISSRLYFFTITIVYFTISPQPCTKYMTNGPISLQKKSRRFLVIRLKNTTHLVTGCVEIVK